MINIGKGRYWDLPWSLVSGCTPCSPGCDHCWAAGIERRFGDGWLSLKDGRFNGRVRPHPDRLSIPLKRRKPTVYAVWNDLFHEAVPDYFIDRAFAAMALCPRHTFLVLTKRPERMLAWFSYDKACRVRADRVSEACGDHFSLDPEADDPTDKWPLPNVYPGLTVCNPAEADEKIPRFLQVPGKKFLSLEPLLGPIKLLQYLIRGECIDRCPEGNDCSECDPGFASQFFDHQIDAVILGGETGPGARPMHPDWVRSVRDQCSAAGVPFFFKQWGEYLPADQAGCPCGPPMKAWMWSDGTPWTGPYNAKDMESRGHKLLRRVGKKGAGRILDGRTHDELPWHRA